MNINKLAAEIYQACYEYRNADGKIKVSRRDDGGFDVYHSYDDSTVAAAYQGDSAQMALTTSYFQLTCNRQTGTSRSKNTLSRN